ncbi:MAG: hypothetical protein QM764_22395 [Chitinophagaceae bacterium]
MMNQDILAQKIADWLLKMHRKLNLFLLRKAGQVPRRVMTFIFSVLCILFLVFSVWAIVKAFRTVPLPITISHLNKPVVAEKLTPPDILPGTILQQLGRYQHYLDSLHDYNPPLFDSICHGRPGLIDSLHEIVKIYSPQP